MPSPRSPGRPRRFDEDEALEAALLVFWRCGYAEASMSALREAMGMSSASIENAFGSKAELFSKVIEYYLTRYGAVTEAATDLQLPPREALRTALVQSLEMQTDPAHPPGCLIALTSPAASHRNADTAVLGTRARNITRARIRTAIERGISAGDLPDSTDVDGLTTTFDSYLLGLSVEVCDGVPAKALHSSIDYVMNAWISVVNNE